MSSQVDMSPEAIWGRIQIVSGLADLRPETRLDAKLDMSPEGIDRRIREVSELRDLCRQLSAAGGVAHEPGSSIFQA